MAMKNGKKKDEDNKKHTLSVPDDASMSCTGFTRAIGYDQTLPSTGETTRRPRHGAHPDRATGHDRVRPYEIFAVSFYDLDSS